ncbi:MAG: fasciclin domain-containing protein [Sandaracinaceae bacterium]
MLVTSTKRGFLCAILLVAAVGCDDGEPETDAGMVDAGATDAGETPTDAGSGNTIADIAASNPDFSMLLAAATRADLGALLSNPAAELTVFAPTNQAFADSGITMAMIDSMPVAQLTGILTYHAVMGRVTSSDIVAGPVTSAAMSSLILGTEGGVTINGGNTVVGGANVVMADIIADNGVIHVIDRVLLPPTVADLARYAGLTELSDALASTGLDATLAGAGPFTVFAPTNDAFPDTAPPGLEDILLYHVVSGQVASTAIPTSAPTLSTVTYTDAGASREVALSLLFDTSSGVAVNGGSGTGATNLGGNVVVADVRATNGIVHVIDGVLVPLSIAEVALAGGFTSLVAAVTASDPIPAALAGSDTPVIDALSASTLAPLTVLAPTDAAFTAAFPGGLPTDGAAILGVLALHVVAAPLPVRAEDLPATPVAPLAGSDLTFDTAATPPTVTVGGGGTSAQIVLTDVGATNGIVHVIDQVLLEGT